MGVGLWTGPSTQGPKCFKEDKWWCEVAAKPGRAEPGKDSWILIRRKWAAYAGFHMGKQLKKKKKLKKKV